MNKIKFFRHKKGLTVKSLSDKANIATGYLSDLENGNSNNPSRTTMVNISKALEQTVPEIFFPEEVKQC